MSQEFPHVTEILSSFDKGWLEYFYRSRGDVTRAMLERMGVDHVNTVDLANHYAKERAESGTRIHKAWEHIADLALAKSFVLEREKPLVEALARWAEAVDLRVVAKELEVVSQQFQFQGRLDMDAEIRKPSPEMAYDFWNNPVQCEGSMFCVLDLKSKDGGHVSAGEMKKHGMQMAAYGQGLSELPEPVIRHFGVMLEADIETACITPRVVQLSDCWPAFNLQRELYRYIKSVGRYAHLRRRKLKEAA